MQIADILKNIDTIIRKREVIDNLIFDLKWNVSLTPSLVGIKFKWGDPNTDFHSYLKRSDILIIYNENYDEYESGTCFPGSGNGFMRQYRSDSDCEKIKAFSLGIPTGSLRTDRKLDDFFNSTMTHRQVIDESIKKIIKLIKNNSDIKYVLWSVNDNGTLGLLTFAGDPIAIATTNYISRIIKKIFPNKLYYSSTPIQHHGNEITII